jgi:hypothetical protein
MVLLATSIGEVPVAGLEPNQMAGTHAGGPAPAGPTIRQRQHPSLLADRGEAHHSPGGQRSRHPLANNPFAARFEIVGEPEQLEEPVTRVPSDV